MKEKYYNKKVNCPYCTKKKPHSHKGCNETSECTIKIEENKVV